MKTEEIVDAARNAGFSSSEIMHRLAAFKRLINSAAYAEREKFTNTQEFVTLPRAVAEQALEALFTYKPMVTGVTFQHGLDAMQALRAALEQPQECYDQRDPLADQQIDAIAESMPGGLDGFLKGWGWRQFARAVLEAAPQPPTTEQSSAVVEECLTDELKPRFSAHDDAERLKSVARGMSYNDHGEAVWKHTLMEIAVRLESGGYAAPQPPALEQQVEKESTCKDSLQVEQAAVAWCELDADRRGIAYFDGKPIIMTGPSGNEHHPDPLYTNPQPQREPLTHYEIHELFRRSWDYCQDGDEIKAFTRAIEAAHNIK